MAEEKKGFLSRIANKVFSIETFLVTIPLAFITGYVGNMVWDFAFFDIIHGTEGLSSEAVKWKMLMNRGAESFHEIAGFTGSSGFLQGEFMNSVFNYFGVEYDITDGYDFPDVIPDEAPTDLTTLVKKTLSLSNDLGLPPIQLPAPGT
jgi:hypothetical protein